jgi:uncharacterized protein (DUF2235 family)
VTTNQVGRNLVVCLDGTWNSYKDRTNVSRLHAAVSSMPSSRDAGRAQLKYYDEGVGTGRWDRLRGGVFGKGLSRNIVQAHAWLIDNYRGGDQIFVFGFSRGAFTARSLVGLINRFGIPEPAKDNSSSLDRAWAAYHAYRNNGPRARDGVGYTEAGHRDGSVRIRFLGVWDTVGALGLPEDQSSRHEEFHDTSLCPIVDHARHALAIDEHRRPYAATLWTAFPDRWDESLASSGQRSVEQRWFPGAHANVGGGYEDDMLPDLPLAWIAAEASKLGLDVHPNLVTLDGSEHRSAVRDSYREFMGGWWSRIRRQRHLRRIGATVVNERIDPSAFRKWQTEPGYRPENLAKAGANVQLAGLA